MKLTDGKALALLERANVWELTEAIRELPETARDGKTDMEILTREAEWLLHKCTTDGYSAHDNLVYYRQVLYDRRMHNDGEKQIARDAHNAFRRLKTLCARLKQK